jgi:hypothetical protein
VLTRLLSLKCDDRFDLLISACFTLHSINATLAIVTQRGAGLWITDALCSKVGANRK